jgi:hypothetical protein
MRILIVLGVVAFGVGLAAQWLPRALGEEAAAERDGDVRTFAMRSATEVTRPSGVRTANAPVASSEAEPELRDSLAEDRPDDSGSAASGADPQRDRVTQLTSAGFTPERAQEIVRRESDLRRSSIEHEYAATGTIHPLNATSQAALERKMRSWMGDSEYEKYLQATGRAIRIRVGDVEPDSVAANAGIVSGDEIRTYAGQRVFNLGDLNALMLQTPEGGMVRTTVVRGGQEMELYLTGGPLGISSAPGP